MKEKYRVVVWDFSTGSPIMHLNKIVKNFAAALKIKSDFEKDRRYKVHFWKENA